MDISTPTMSNRPPHAAEAVRSVEPTLEDKLQRYVEQILNKPDFPAFSAQIGETMALLDEEEVSARKLGEVVARNYGLALKLLQVANAFGHNPTGVPIFGVEQAIFRLGVERVRSMAGGLVFFEHFRGHSEAVKELVVLSLVTANQAESAAEKLGFPQPEEAYLCGMLRNLGEVLIAAYFPEELARIRAELSHPGMPLARACRAVMGFTYDELGVAMISRWRMPAEVGDAMRSDSDVRSSAGPTAVNIAQLAHTLTSAIYRSPGKDAATRVSLIIQKFGGPLGVTKDMLEQIANTAGAETRTTLTRLKLASKDVQLLDKSRAALAFGKKVSGGTLAAIGGAATSATHTALNPRVFAQLERDVDDLMRVDKGPGDLQAVVLTVLDAMQRGAGFDRALFALVNQERDVIQGRLAVGTGADDLRAGFTIPLGPSGGPIGIALGRHQELMIRSDHDLQPEAVVQLQQFGARMLGILPLAAKGQLIGCLYYDQVKAVCAPTAVVEAALRRLRDRTVQVLSRKR